jgi:PAS domain S-box-containing protein
MNREPLNSSSPFAVVVNDDPTQLKMLSLLVRKAGLEPRPFTDAEAALAEMSASVETADRDLGILPAIVVTDLYMPGIDGWRFCRLLRSPEYAAFNQIPILVVSSTFSGDEAARIAADLCAEAFLPSPVDGKRFVEQVQAILSGKRVRPPLRMLIVEDSQTLAGIIKKAFAAHGYQADTALTVREAAASFARTAYDVAVLDYHLPDGLGDTLLDAFRSQRPDCACLMMTNDTRPELALDWMKRGAAAYLKKPFQTDYLIELCARARSERALLRVQDLIEVRTSELRESEAKQRLLFDNANDAIFIHDAHAQMLAVNPMACERLGYTHSELMSMTINQVDSPEEAQHVQERITRLIEQGHLTFETVHQCKDGSLVPTEVSARRITWDKQLAVMSICRNITNRKRAEAEKAQLEAQNRQLQKAESLGRMAGAIAHHFNNQLYAVMGNLEMAMDDQPLGVNSNESLVSAMQAARKAADVSRLMLTYLGQSPCNQESIDLSETCRQSQSLLQAATPRGIIINAEFPSSGPVIRADANQIHQILTNLITNAWESISDNLGAIDLTIKTVSHTDIPTSKRFPIDWQPKEIAYTCMEVSDTGSGIANKDIEKIFDPFFTTKFTGRGLGLSVVMGIIKAHGGGVTVESEPGRGSTFRVFLPVSTEKLHCQPDLPNMPGALQTGKTEKISKTKGNGAVLLVEDEDMVRNMAKLMLTRLGYTVLEAKDGVEALEIFQRYQNEICCILSDLTMPRMDGWETLSALRKLSPDIPVILSSGYDEAQVMAGEHTEQPNAFLGKPYQLKGLRETISHVLAE